MGSAVLIGVWFLFYPNAPYIVTDLIHLSPRWPIPVWYDLMVIVFNAWTGLALAICSLYQMQNIATLRFGQVWGRILAATTIVASGLGVYIGRFLDWNSWDIVLVPADVIRLVAANLLNVSNDPTALVASSLFAILLGLTYCFVRIGVAPQVQSQRAGNP